MATCSCVCGVGIRDCGELKEIRCSHGVNGVGNQSSFLVVLVLSAASLNPM